MFFALKFLAFFSRGASIHVAHTSKLVQKVLHYRFRRLVVVFSSQSDKLADNKSIISYYIVPKKQIGATKSHFYEENDAH